MVPDLQYSGNWFSNSLLNVLLYFTTKFWSAWCLVVPITDDPDILHVDRANKFAKQNITIEPKDHNEIIEATTKTHKEPTQWLKLNIHTHIHTQKLNKNKLTLYLHWSLWILKLRYITSEIWFKEGSLPCWTEIHHSVRSWTKSFPCRPVPKCCVLLCIHEYLHGHKVYGKTDKWD